LDWCWGGTFLYHFAPQYFVMFWCDIFLLQIYSFIFQWFVIYFAIYYFLARRMQYRWSNGHGAPKKTGGMEK
jgi:purine-cytosine permease-like protein